MIEINSTPRGAPKWDGHTSKDIGRLFSLVETNGY